MSWEGAHYQGSATVEVVLPGGVKIHKFVVFPLQLDPDFVSDDADVVQEALEKISTQALLVVDGLLESDCLG